MARLVWSGLVSCAGRGGVLDEWRGCGPGLACCFVHDLCAESFKVGGAFPVVPCFGESEGDLDNVLVESTGLSEFLLDLLLVLLPCCRADVIFCDVTNL